MGGRAIAALALLALVAAPGALAQGTCVIESDEGRIEYPCNSWEDQQEAPAEEPWWANDMAQAVVGIVGLVGSVAAGAYAWFRLRSRRRALTGYLARVEEAAARAKAAPEEGIPHLVDLRSELRLAHRRGRVEDAHFLELDKRATDYLVRARLMELERRFGHLPPSFLSEVRHLVGDGTLSAHEADLIEQHAASYGVPESARVLLVATVRGWSREDAPVAAAPAPAAPRFQMSPP